MSFDNIGRAANHASLGDLRRSRVRRFPSRDDPKPPLPPIPETTEQRVQRERRAASARLRGMPAQRVDWMADLDATARAWAVAPKHERKAIIEGLAAKYPRGYSAASRAVIKRARELGLVPRRTP